MIFKFMLLLSLMSLSWGLEAKKEIPLAVDGVIDLKNWDFEKDGIVDLKGQWKFFYQQEIKPEDLLNNPQKIKEAETLAIPSSWVSDKYSRFSYGSLLLEIKNIDQKSAKKLGFSNTEISSSGLFTLFTIKNSEIKIINQFSGGKFSAEKDKVIHQRIDLIEQIEYMPENVYLIAHIANHKGRAAGLNKSLYLGLFLEMIKEKENLLIRDNIVSGAILIMAIYHFFLFGLRKEDTASFAFGIFSLLVFIRSAAQGPIVIDWTNYTSNFIYDLRFKIEYIDLYLLIPAISAFFYKVLGSYDEKILKAVFVINGLFALFTLLTPTSIFTFGLTVYEPILLLQVLYILFVVGREFFRGHPDARLMLYSGLFLALCAINDILYAKNLIPTMFLLSFGFLAFLFTQSFIISKRFAAAQRQAEYLSENLKVEVDKQTKELRTKSQKLEEQNDIIASQYDKIKNDVQVAADVMEAMLPETSFKNKECLFESLFIPADELAGDLYGMEAREKRLMFWLCDVTGHGVASSMVAGVVREGMAGCRLETLFTAEEPDPARALRTVSAQVAKSIKGKFFATMSLGVYDFDTKILTIASAAHLKPIHFREGKWIKNTVGKVPNGPLIGFVGETTSEYKNFQVKLESNDFLFFYTDGVNEAAFSDETEQFGKKRIVRFLKKQLENPNLLKDLLNEVYKFQNKPELDDDITMAILKIP